MSLSKAEQLLRQDDKALRLRHSLEGPYILVERKTFRGRIGSISPQLGRDWAPDAGARRELGHVLVASIPRNAFDVRVLRESLRAADTWRASKPLWQRVEEAEEAKRRRVVLARKDGLRYKSSEVFDRYVWKYKQRVNVPVQVS